MTPGYRPFAWTAAAIAAGVVVVLAIRAMGGDAEVPAAPPETVAAAPAIADEPAAAPLPPAMAPAPWEQGQAPMSPGSAISAFAVPGDGAAAVTNPAEAAASIATIREQSQRNVAMVDNLLRELDALERSGQGSPDMRLDALRDNLKIARRAQALALELAESTQQPDSPARQKRTSEIVAELQALQGKLRYDLVPAGLPMAERTP